MPLDLADFLARDEDLARLRRVIAAGTSQYHRPRRAERDLVALLTRRWHNGVAGWLTAAEGDRVAADLNAKAELVGRAALASAEDLDAGWFLLFRGGRIGEWRLALATTSPIAAALAWDTYLTSCPRARLRPIAGGVR